MNADTAVRFMEVAVVPIVIALITAAISAFRIVRTSRRDIESLRQENTAQHNRGVDLLDHLSRQVTGIDGKIDQIDDKVGDLQIWAVEHEKQHLLDASEDRRRDSSGLIT